MLNRYALLAAAGFLLMGCNKVQSNPTAADAPAAASSAAIPAPVQALAKAGGIEIHGSLQAPLGYQGFVGSYRDQPVPVYLLPDGQHVVIGSLYDAKGGDLTSGPFRDAITPKLDASLWESLQQTHWVAEGSDHPKRIVYVFTDTECPYCHRLWQATQPYLQQGDVQIRNIIVAVIAPESLGRGAAVLSAADPHATYLAHEQHFRNNSPVPVLKDVPTDVKRKIAENEALMDKLQIEGTPTVLYKDAGGSIRMVPGMPSQDTLKSIFGS
ncbi:thiol:disulfide interchange protein DsbG [Frateuria aurantia]